MTLDFFSVITVLPIHSYKPFLAFNRHPSLLHFHIGIGYGCVLLAFETHENVAIKSVNQNSMRVVFDVPSQFSLFRASYSDCCDLYIGARAKLIWNNGLCIDHLIYFEIIRINEKKIYCEFKSLACMWNQFSWLIFFKVFFIFYFKTYSVLVLVTKLFGIHWIFGEKNEKPLIYKWKIVGGWFCLFKNVFSIDLKIHWDELFPTVIRWAWVQSPQMHLVRFSDTFILYDDESKPEEWYQTVYVNLKNEFLLARVTLYHCE